MSDRGWRSTPLPSQGTVQIWTRWIYWMSGRDKSVCWVVTFNNNYKPWRYRCSTASNVPTGGWQSTPSHHLKTKDWLDLNLSHLHFTRSVKNLCCYILCGLVNQIKPSVDRVLSETSNYECWNFFWKLMENYCTSFCERWENSMVTGSHSLVSLYSPLIVSFFEAKS